MVTKSFKYQNLAGKLLLIFLGSVNITGACYAGGNAKLMEQQRNRAFLLNKEILSTLDSIEGHAKVSFSGSVVRGADGKLKIKIDNVDGVTPYALSRSMSERTKIEYITFEEMMGVKPSKNDNQQQTDKKADHKELMYGGGSTTN